MLLTVMSNLELNKEDVPSVDLVSSPAKGPRTPLAELKNGKVTLKQKPVSFESMSETMQEIVSIRSMLDDRMKTQCAPLDSVPDEYMPLIAKLVHESDKTLLVLTRYVHRSVLPIRLDLPTRDEKSASSDSQEQLSLQAIENAIISIAERKNYGVDCVEKVPAALCIWRWEVKEQKRHLLPNAGRDILETRIAERRQAKEDLLTLFNALPREDKDALLKGIKKERGKNQASGDRAMSPVQFEKHEEEEQENKQDLQSSGSASGAKGRPRLDKSVDPEKILKEKERTEKKALKAEKERKAKEAQNKSRSLLSAFLKPKPTGKTAKALKSQSTTSTSDSVASSSQSDFAKSFKPFVVKKDATVAPINWFTRQQKTSDVIVIDDIGTKNEDAINLDDDKDTPADTQMLVIQHDSSLASMNSQELLKSNLNAALPSLGSKSISGRRYSSQYKSTSRYCVRTILAQLTEAEVAGEPSVVRELTDLLQSRKAIPAKVFIFHDDNRPGYFGTFTKSSTFVGPRCPLNKDPVAFDYSYDSGAEWEEEEEGADDLMSLGGSGDEDEGSVDSDLDDWLIDDDAVDVDPGTPLSDCMGSPDAFLLPPPKRKPAVNPEARDTKKRKVVVPLVPFTKGPCWEKRIGMSAYEPFQEYRIQLFNDTPFPIDPFTFVSSPVAKAHTQPSTSKDGYVVPAVPARLLNTPSRSQVSGASDPVSKTPSGSLTPTNVPPKKTVSQQPPKTSFPDVHLPHLINTINILATGNLTFIVESVYRDLKDTTKLKKYAIEAKVKEIGEKCKVKKVWVVKENVRTILPSMDVVKT